jgi:hypothetical protein
MPVTNRQGPKYFFTPHSVAYRNNYEAIDFTKKENIIMENKVNPVATEVVAPKRGKGRPKGSKNKPKDPNAPPKVKKNKKSADESNDGGLPVLRAVVGTAIPSTVVEDDTQPRDEE